MSFFDGIVNGMKAVFGIDSAPPDAGAKRTERPEPPQRGENLAADTPTRFERTARPVGPTLAERIASAAPATPTRTTRTTPTPSRTMSTAGVAPHLIASRTSTPPIDPSTAAGATTESAATIDTAIANASASDPSSTTGPASPDSATAPSPSPTRSARARVLDAGTGQELGTIDTLGDSGSDAAAAAASVQHGLDYYSKTFGRDGLDGAGAGVDVLINDRSTDDEGNERFAGNGGYFATPQADGSVTEAIHFGVGQAYDGARGRVDHVSMLHAADLAIHELTHGIIRKETGHLGGEADESGATNEAVADVMSAAATRDWRIGEAMYTEHSDYRAMRNIADPDDPTAIHGLWTSIDDVRSRQQAGEDVEEHWASGVISTAAHRVQSRLGGEAGWQAVERVFYDTIDNSRMGDMSFTAVAAGLRASAAAVYGEGSSVDQVFDEELRRAGL